MSEQQNQKQSLAEKNQEIETTSRKNPLPNEGKKTQKTPRTEIPEEFLLDDYGKITPWDCCCG